MVLKRKFLKTIILIFIFTNYYMYSVLQWPIIYVYLRNIFLIGDSLGKKGRREVGLGYCYIYFNDKGCSF